MTQTIQIESLQLDRTMQARAGMDTDTVNDYSAAMKAGREFPPVTVIRDGVTLWLADGFHRVTAAQQVGALTVSATVTEGTRRDALLVAVGANANHGLRRNNADKRRAVTMVFSDEQLGELSDREIARLCGVSHTFVANVRAELVADVRAASLATVATDKPVDWLPGPGQLAAAPWVFLNKRAPDPTDTPWFFVQESELERGRFNVVRFDPPTTESPDGSMLRMFEKTLSHDELMGIPGSFGDCWGIWDRSLKSLEWRYRAAAPDWLSDKWGSQI